MFRWSTDSTFDRIFTVLVSVCIAIALVGIVWLVVEAGQHKLYAFGLKTKEERDKWVERMKKAAIIAGVGLGLIAAVLFLRYLLQKSYAAAVVVGEKATTATANIGQKFGEFKDQLGEKPLKPMTGIAVRDAASNMQRMYAF